MIADDTPIGTRVVLGENRQPGTPPIPTGTHGEIVLRIDLPERVLFAVARDGERHGLGVYRADELELEVGP